MSSVNGKATIILGVIGSDCHAVGNRILDRFFKDAGFNVVNLGVMTPQDEFVDAARETHASAILVSSLYGHGEIDCRGMRDRCREAGIGDIVLYAGGNLTVGSRPFEEVQKVFEEMGFDRVFSAETDLELALDLLRKDIKAREIN